METPETILETEEINGNARDHRDQWRLERPMETGEPVRLGRSPVTIAIFSIAITVSYDNNCNNFDDIPYMKK